MPKVFLTKVKEKKESAIYNLDQIKRMLAKNNACYVLITCSEPSQDGKMQVELDYDGDQNLAAYLVDGAQKVFDDEQEKQLG
ncbi:MAG: hypothetical protein HZB76_04560 [Chlamydiae bacterium]|nr:hypothetical protein [Chlamydiota bacterium]